ncbi:MAG: TonB-dependent receptor, partial [Spirochaetaceae bacterium]|nr:TonB-dependent receptor [Spirochaetaceae bacterium]
KFAPVKQVVLSADVSGNFDFLKNDAKMLYGFRAGVGAIWQPHENIRLELPLHFYWFNGDYLLSPKLNAGFFWPKVFFSLAAYPVWSHRETTYLGRDIFRKGENGYGAEITVGSPVVPLTLSVYTVYLRKILMGTATTVGDNLVISMANNGKQISLGGTISADIPITPNFDLKAGYSFIYTSIFEGNINFLGSSALNLPQHIFILGFNAKLGNLRINLLSKMYSERFIGDTPDENLPAYFLVDLALRYRISNFDIYLKTENTLDKRYWGNLAVPGESLGITLGCNYTFR